MHNTVQWILRTTLFLISHKYSNEKDFFFLEYWKTFQVPSDTREHLISSRFSVPWQIVWTWQMRVHLESSAYHIYMKLFAGWILHRAACSGSLCTTVTLCLSHGHHMKSAMIKHIQYFFFEPHVVTTTNTTIKYDTRKDVVTRRFQCSSPQFS